MSQFITKDSVQVIDDSNVLNKYLYIHSGACEQVHQVVNKRRFIPQVWICCLIKQYIHSMENVLSSNVQSFLKNSPFISIVRDTDQRLI